MIDHTIEQIESTGRYFQKNSYPLVEKSISGRDFRYYVIPQSMNLDLADFIFRVTNDESKKYVIAVSESIPEVLQPYFALAEYIEFIEIGLGRENRVLMAEKEVLSKIPEDISEEYIRRKIKLLKRELELDLIHPDDTYLLGEDGRNEFNNAISFLEEKIKDAHP